MSKSYSYEESLVLRVNEIYHDLEGDKYSQKHEDIFVGEQDNWKKIISNLFAEGENYTVLEVGVGTGFVASQICPQLSQGSIYYCTDISDNILNAAKKNLKPQDYRCRIEFLKIDGKSYPFPDNSIDIVTINSVLHHIPNIPSFFSEMKRVLKPGGKMVIGHEPNKAFFSHPFLWNQYRFLSLLFFPKQLLYRVCLYFGIVDFVKFLLQKKSATAPVVSEYSGIVKEINKILLDEKSIDVPLSEEDISAIIDIHSPTAGRNDPSRGIDIRKDVSQFLPGFDITNYFSYNYLHKLSRRNFVFSFYEDCILKKIFPEAGATFFVVISGKE